MSLTILFQFPVDTGTAKISPKVEKANLKDFYLLTGKSSLIFSVASLPRAKRRAPFGDNNSICQAPSSICFREREGAVLYFFNRLQIFHININSLFIKEVAAFT